MTPEQAATHDPNPGLSPWRERERKTPWRGWPWPSLADEWDKRTWWPEPTPKVPPASYPLPSRPSETADAVKVRQDADGTVHPIIVGRLEGVALDATTHPKADGWHLHFNQGHGVWLHRGDCVERRLAETAGMVPGVLYVRGPAQDDGTRGEIGDKPIAQISKLGLRPTLQLSGGWTGYQTPAAPVKVVKTTRAKARAKAPKPEPPDVNAATLEALERERRNGRVLDAAYRLAVQRCDEADLAADAARNALEEVKTLFDLACARVMAAEARVEVLLTDLSRACDREQRMQAEMTLLRGFLAVAGETREG